MPPLDGAARMLELLAHLELDDDSPVLHFENGRAQQARDGRQPGVVSDEGPEPRGAEALPHQPRATVKATYSACAPRWRTR